MRALLGTTPTALARRGCALDRLAGLTLRRDAYAAEPVAELPLWLGERTQYRAAAVVLDTFERANGPLGRGYAPWIAGAPTLILQNQAAVPAAVGGAAPVMLYETVLARDQWSEATVQALSGTAMVGVGVRFVADTGYLVVASIGHVQLTRVSVGTATTLLNVVTTWQPGDRLRLTAEWNRLRIYRNGVCLGDLIDASPLLTAGQMAITASRSVATDAAGVTNLVAGALRQEYVGLLADLGDVSTSLGLLEPTARPASWSMSVINRAPIGGAPRFSELWRHGDNTGEHTYELPRAPVRVLHAVHGGSASFMLADGRVDHAEDLTETALRLVCLGRDAFLMPKIEPGPVQYLPGPDPISTAAPVPEDPCGTDAPPTINAGSVPAEPAGETGPVAEGPEAGAPDELLTSVSTTLWMSWDRVGQLPSGEQVYTAGSIDVMGIAIGPPLPVPIPAPPLAGPFDVQTDHHLEYGTVPPHMLQAYDQRRAWYVIKRTLPLVGTRLRFDGQTTTDPSATTQVALNIYVTAAPVEIFETAAEIREAPKTRITWFQRYDESDPAHQLPPDGETMAFDIAATGSQTFLLEYACGPRVGGPPPLIQDMASEFLLSTLVFA